MSLKAKLEAVIYAAEEPVTLAQLSALFASEALEWKSEQAANAEQAAENQAAESLSLIPTELGDLDVDQTSGSSAVPETDPETAVAEPQPDAVPDSSPELTAAQGAGTAISPLQKIDEELEAKRLVRQRDREVRAALRDLLDELIVDYASDNRGIEIREIAGGYRMATKPECHDAVRAFVKSLKPPMKLSLPALETLAVIAYKQPVTAPEVNEIRGVESSGVFGSLLARKLIATAGRKQVIGRPILYKTTREFLLRFGLKDVTELPSMEEFEKMAALELDDSDSSSSEEPGLTNASEADQNRSLDFDQSLAEESTGEVSAESPEVAETSVTAEMAASIESSTPDEAAPAAPPATEQAETETSSNGEEIHQNNQSR
ncbi:MAG: SMC-Scp complex subunit ScpB [Terracidiphilus sp.]|jgi:segregation and condensation protein B